MKSITIVGAGTMGRSLSELFIKNKFNVELIDNNVDVLLSTLEHLKSLFGETENISDYELNFGSNILKGILKFNKTISSEIIIETVPEDLKLKRQIIKEIELKSSKNAIICTNTSGLPITEIGVDMKFPERLIGMHFFTPASIIPLVEVINGDKTSVKVSEIILKLLIDLGKKPILVKKDIPGFIGNRIQHAISREAMHLLKLDVASAEDIDEIVKWSIGLRLAISGPFEQRDINGIDIHYKIADYLYKDLNNETKPSTLLAKKISEGKLGIKSLEGFYDWRNKNLSEYFDNKNKSLTSLIKVLEDEL